MAGGAEVMVAGGTEANLTPLTIGGFNALKALSTRNDAPEKASRPFDKERDGFVIGEGAGIVILEELDHARKRGATIYAEVAGYGMSGDAHHISSPSEDGDGPKRVMRAAIKDAGISPEQVAYVNAHGTSTPAGDRIECAAIKGVFGDHVKSLKVSSTKSMTGHLLGAAGGLETIVVAKVIETGQIPPTINVENQDPDCDLDVCAGKIAAFDGEYALNNNFGFGGTNACVILRKV